MRAANWPFPKVASNAEKVQLPSPFFFCPYHFCPCFRLRHGGPVQIGDLRSKGADHPPVAAHPTIGIWALVNGQAVRLHRQVIPQRGKRPWTQPGACGGRGLVRKPRCVVVGKRVEEKRLASLQVGRYLFQVRNTKVRRPSFNSKCRRSAHGENGPLGIYRLGNN